MRISKMTTNYQPVTREQLMEISDEQLLMQYQSLADLIRETIGIPFERNPNCERDKLIIGVVKGQRDFLGRHIFNNLDLEEAKKDILEEAIKKYCEITESENNHILCAGGTY